MYYRDYLGEIWGNSKIHDCQPILENYRHWLLRQQGRLRVELYYETLFWEPLCFLFASFKGIRIPESRKFLLVESEILGFGIRNAAQEIRNPFEHWTEESKVNWQRIRNPVPGIRNPRCGTQNARRSWISLQASGQCDYHIVFFLSVNIPPGATPGHSHGQFPVRD